jgi:predicted dehydrogenase
MSDPTVPTAQPVQPLGIGVIGLGFMGCTHVRSYQSAAAAGFPCKLVAVADRSAERLSGRAFVQGNIDTGSAEQLFDPARVRGYVDPRELVTDPRVDAVSICTHTDTHVDLAIAALRAGKHVLVEKPVATSSAEVRRLASAAAVFGKVCMPAMVMRFWPEWVWLRDAVRAGTHGKALSASFQRMGSSPGWTDFYRDSTRSGGALFDLHIHDADFIRWCFGEPREVVSIGTIDHLTTLYRFADNGATPLHVAAEGAQNITPGFGFRMRYTVVFERATADFDIARTPTLLLSREGRSEPVVLSSGVAEVAGVPNTAPTAYEAEVRAFVRAIASGAAGLPLVADISDAVQTAVLLETELRSLLSNAPQRVA